jgi:hypothetical protein
MSVKMSLPAPQLSAYDPPLAGEGRLDPLGFGVIADRIANTYARPVRARMQRVRFLTAISLGGLFVEELGGVEPAVSGDTAELAYERVVVEAVARARRSSDPGMPGITKAQAALLADERLSARGYLKGPRIFGFHGVYRTLVASNGVLDQAGGILPAGQQLLEVVEQEADLFGLSNPTQSGPGSELLSWLRDETRKTLENGRNVFRPRSTFVEVIASLASPSGAGIEEKHAIARILREPLPSAFGEDDEAYLETLQLLPAGARNEFPETELVSQLVVQGSSSLQARMKMLLAYEQFARDLTFLFDSYRYWSGVTLDALTPGHFLTRDDSLGPLIGGLADRYRRALESIDAAVQFGIDPELPLMFTMSFGAFGDHMGVDEFIEVMMVHHQGIQKSKPPSGKRPWLEPIADSWMVRPMFSVSDKPEHLEDFIHPYRLSTLANFMADLRE